MVTLMDSKWLSRLILISVVICHTHGKPKPNEAPAVSNQPSSSKTMFPAETAPRGIVGFNSPDGTWQASARLPPSSESGGNPNSRYNIRRDGSLSIALKAEPTAPTPQSQFEWEFGRSRGERKVSPTEVRSFSVILSDVDVVGRYPEANAKLRPDSFSEGGVSGYQLHSNTVHRMNASWKLNPRRSRVSTDELLQFLSYFAKENQQLRRQRKMTSSSSRGIENDDGNLPHFTTWSDTEYNDNDKNDRPQKASLFLNRGKSEGYDAGGNNGTREGGVVLHDLIATLEKLIEPTREIQSENNSSSIGSDVHQPYPHHDSSEYVVLKNGTRTRMSATDPQQTAADLKKLVSLLLKSADEDVKEMDGSGAEVVNVVITPNAGPPANLTRQEERQKILFLKSPQVKHLLDVALSDPTVSVAAQKIAAALHSSPYPNEENSYDSYEEKPISGNEIVSMTPGGIPNGFPLNASTFLNLQHPNLQFHQALHHLVANGSAPSSINATTKTNVINIFVLNFNSQPVSGGGEEHNVSETTISNPPFKLKPPVIYGNVNRRPELLTASNPSATVRPSLAFFSKVGLPAHGLEEKHDKTPSLASNPKPFIDVTSNGDPYVAVTPSSPLLLLPSTSTTAPDGKINILDLLPGSLNSFTRVDFASGVANKPPSTGQDSSSINVTSAVTMEKLESEAAELLSYFSHPEHSVNPIDQSQPALPAEFSPLHWILKQEPPPKPFIKKPSSKLNLDDESSYEYLDESTESASSPPSSLLDKRLGLPMFTDLTIKHGDKATPTKPANEDNRPLYEQILTTTTTARNSTKSLEFLKSNKTEKGVKSKLPPSPSSPTPKPATVVTTTVSTAEKMKNRLRNLISALGYSSIPTLAAGAVATWPYWAPMVASAGLAGRTNRRRRASDIPIPSTSQLLKSITNSDKDQHNDSFPQGNKSEQVVAHQWENSTFSSLGVGSSSGDGQEQSEEKKWIKVEVITESSPTLLPSPPRPKKENKARGEDENGNEDEEEDNNRQFVNGEPSDVPLLKNFLKNVLSSEWNISTTTPAYSSTPIPLSLSPVHIQSQHQILQSIHAQSTTPTPILLLHNQNPNRVQLEWRSSTIEPELPISAAVHQPTAVKTKDGWTVGRTDGRDYFTSKSSRQRNNRRLHKIEDVPDLAVDLSDDLTHDVGTEDESPLVQSLTAMASSLTADQSAENSSEKDVVLSEDISPQDTEPSDGIEQELEQASDEDHKGTDEETHPQMQSPTIESKTLVTGPNFVSTWSDDDSMNNNNMPARSSTTPKGLTTWSAVNGGGAHLIDQFEETGFKGTVQRVPSDSNASAMLVFNQRPPGMLPSSTPSTSKPISTSPFANRENPEADSSTTEIPRTTKSNPNMSMRKKPPPLSINRLKPHKKPIPSKFIKTPPEQVVATAISSDDRQTTYQLKPVTEEHKTTDPGPSRYTRRPGYPWPINPNVITTPRPNAANKKVAFQKIGGSTKRPNPYLKRTEIPKLSLTTPTTSSPISTTVYYRTPGVPLVNAFPLTLSNMPFIDFIRSQILPRIGLSLISFMATSPLILSLLGMSAVAGRKKRDLNEPPFKTGVDLSKLLDLEEDNAESKSVKKHGALYDKTESPEKELDSTIYEKVYKSPIKSSINKKNSKFASKIKYVKGT